MRPQPVIINFSQGLNTKTDPWQIPIGQFARLKNSIFQKGGLLQKRPGYPPISLSVPPSTYITTLNDNLTAIGSSINAYSTSLGTWVSKGSLQPCSLSVLSLIRNNLNQTQSDTAVANGLVLTTFTQSNGLTSSYYYAVADATTGQNVVAPTAIPAFSTGAISGSPRAFVVGPYFVIVCPVTVSSNTYLQYVSLSVMSPGTASAAQQVTSDLYVALSSNAGWDGVSVNSGNAGTLVLAYNTTTGGQGVHVATINSNQVATNSVSSTIHQFTNAAYEASLMSVCVDLTANPNVYYVNFWNPTNTNAYALGVTIGFGSITQQFAPTATLTSVTLSNITAAAQNASSLVFAEVSNNYGYDSTIVSNYVQAVSVSNAGVVGAPYTAVRGVGIASKGFIVSGTIYFLSAYQSPFQPSYFLMNGSTTTAASPIVTAKLAYQNGGGYLSLGLPAVNVSGTAATTSYLFKDLVQAVSTNNTSNLATVGGIYSQTGINAITFTLSTSAVQAIESVGNLHLSGGFLSQYDGYLPVEHNFFLFPDSVEATYTEDSTVSPTGTASNGANTIVVSSATGIVAGMSIADATNPSYIPGGTLVVSISGTTVTMSNNTTHAISGDTLTIRGNIADQPDGATNTNAYYAMVTYEWTDNQGLIYRSGTSIPVSITTASTTSKGTITYKIPTLRLTAKVANPVKIVIYRWSVKNQTYFQTTSISQPLMNDTTVDYVTFVDPNPDSAIVGNSDIYTTGGVVPNFNAPATSLVTKFDNRVWEISAENPNLAFVSKQVVQGAPVDMSSRFSIFVAPTTGTTKPLGPVTSWFPMDDKLIFFFKEGMCYINGAGPDDLGTTSIGSPLGNYSQPTYIASTVGCTNPNSIVLTPEGLMFQSDKGIWLLDHGLGTSYIGAAVEDFNSFAVNSAQVIPDTNYVLFTLTGTNQFLMYDYYWKQWGTFEGVNAISSCIYQNKHTVLDAFGRVAQATPGVFMDFGNPVLMSLTTGWINLATIQGYQRLYDMLFLMNYLSPHFLNCRIAYEYNSSAYHSVILKPKNFTPATPSPYGVPTPFGGPAQLEQWRVHAKRQTCQSFQLSIDEVWDSTLSSVPGAGFTMSGLTANVGIKKAARPIPGSSAGGFS